MARCTHGQLAHMTDDKWTKTKQYGGILCEAVPTRSWSFSLVDERDGHLTTPAPNVMGVVYNLAVILLIQWCGLQGQGAHPSTTHNIKERTSAIYTPQVYNHGFHVVRQLQACNLEPALCRGLCCMSSQAQETVRQRCLCDEILWAPLLAFE